MRALWSSGPRKATSSGSHKDRASNPPGSHSEAHRAQESTATSSYHVSSFADPSSPPPPGARPRLSAPPPGRSVSGSTAPPRFLLDKAGETPRKLESIQFHITLLGTSRVGKSSLLDRFHEDRFTDAYSETLGLKYEEKRVPKTAQGKELIISCTEIGGSSFDEEESLCVGLPSAHAVLLVFDLTRLDTLAWLQRSYAQARSLAPQARVFLVGCKYDLFLLDLTLEEQRVTTLAVREYARDIKAPLVYTSASHSVNCATLMKLAVWKCLGGDDGGVKQIHGEEEPIVEYEL